MCILRHRMCIATTAAAVAAGHVRARGAAGPAQCHEGHSHRDDPSARIAQLEQQVARMASMLERQLGLRTTTGQGEAVFSWDQDLTACFPEAAKPFEKNMHGGFNEDSDTGIVYTGIPGCGLFSISCDLKTWTPLGTDDRLKSNIHGLVVFKHGGKTLIAAAQNDAQRVLIIGLDGTIVQQLDIPTGGEFNFAEANAYYSQKQQQQCPWGQPKLPRFACTDVTFMEGLLYVTTGYCLGDFVLTAHFSKEKDCWAWGPTAWGGKGDGAGQFNTAHGIFAYNGHIYVANREANQVIQFTKDGSLVKMFADIPETARICNVARADNYFVMNALEPIQHTPAKTASVYAHTGDKLISTIQPGELGIPILKHLHHVWPHYVTDVSGNRTLYLLLHGWSAGKFAVLKHEPDGDPSIVHGWDLVNGGQK